MRNDGTLSPDERDEVALQTAAATQKAARESKRAADAIESGQTLGQRKVEQMRRIRDAYKKTAQDYDAHVARRAYDAGSIDRYGSVSTNTVPSYFRDLINWRSDPEAQQRIHRDAADPAARAGKFYRAGLNTTTTSGGEFELVKNAPNYIVDAFANGVQAESVLSAVLTPWPMPEFGIHVSTPTVSTPSGAGSVAEGSSLSNTDPVTALVDSPKVTIAGRVGVSEQLVDLGGMTAEQFLAQELGASNAGEFERQICVGGGTNELTGLFGTSGISTATYTDAAPKALAYLTALGKAMGTFATNRKRLPDAIVVSPRRWAFLVAPQDATTLSVFGNATPPLRTNGATRGLVGSFGGIAVYASAGIPATQGGSNNEDRPLLLHTPDLWLLSTAANFKISDQLGTTLSQTAIAYRYAALVVRQPSAIGTMTGTGCVLPAGF